MFGSILKSAIKIGTAPADILDIGADVLTGGNGSRASRRDSPLSGLFEARDNFADACEELDED